MQELVYGYHAVGSLLAVYPEKLQGLYVQAGRTDERLRSIVALAEEKAVTVLIKARAELDQLSHGASHQGIVALCNERLTYAADDLPILLANSRGSSLVLLLDRVQDPHNLGACLRSADAAGVQAVIVPKAQAAGVTAVVSKVACGAAETVPFVQVSNLVRCMQQLQALGVWIYGAAATASTSLYQLDLTGSVALVLGAEGEGLRQLTQKHCDGLFAIPMLGTVSSLNVSVATGISLFEAVRQRQAKNGQ
jgi:23S rRNA (guanosine2251-2'-O)-methyltransferase